MTTGNKALTTIAVLLTLFLGWLLFWPVPFDPIAHTPGTNPAGVGIYQRNGILIEARLLTTGAGPEGVALDADGNMYTGLADGRIVRYAPDGSAEELAKTDGRPLGLEFDASGNLVIATADVGLQLLTPEGVLSTLTDTVDGTPIGFADDLAIAADGVIWFSDASQRHGIHSGALELFESRPSGRLLRYSPASGETEVILENLGFANGVALSEDESFLLVNETHRYRITRYWLKGEKAGTSDLFIGNLPGYPDNITEAPGGGFWVAMPAARSSAFDDLLSQPFTRKAVWRLMQVLGMPQPEQQSWAIKLSAGGVPVQVFEDSTGHYTELTSVIEQDGQLYLGSLRQPAIGVLAVPALP